MATPKKKIWSDSLKAIMPVAVPWIVKKVLDLVPPGTKLDDFLEKYKEYWTKAAPMASTLIMQLTNAPEFVDEIVAELSAEVARSIKERYTDEKGFIKKSDSTGKDSRAQLKTAMGKVSPDTLKELSALINGLPEEQRKRVLDFEVSSVTDAKELIENISLFSPAEFKIWADIIAPPKQPRVDTKLEKAVKESVESFKGDAKTFFKKETFLVRLAKKHKP